MQHSSARLLTLMAVTLLTLVLAAPAEARQRANHGQRQAIRAGLVAKYGSGVRVERYTWISTVNRRWAYVNIDIPEVGWGNGIMYRNQRGRWVIRDQFTTWVDCKWKTIMGSRVYNDVVHRECMM